MSVRTYTIEPNDPLAAVVVMLCTELQFTVAEMTSELTNPVVLFTSSGKFRKRKLFCAASHRFPEHGIAIPWHPVDSAHWVAINEEHVAAITCGAMRVRFMDGLRQVDRYLRNAAPLPRSKLVGLARHWEGSHNG